MYRPTEYAKKNPTYILHKKGVHEGIGVLPAEENQPLYEYAYKIGLTKWVEWVEPEEVVEEVVKPPKKKK